MISYVKHHSNLTLSIFHLVISCFLLCISQITHAGSIGFSISFTGDDISISNTGSDAAYQVSGWTLNAQGQWRLVAVRDGNPAYLPPGQSLKGHRSAAAPATPLGRADPLLVLLHDQAGSQIVQLAWRQTPALALQPLSLQRRGPILGIAQPSGLSDIVASYAVVVPYQGIARLAQPLPPTPVPPAPVRHRGSDPAPWVLDTGAGQGGAWLLHESANGTVSLQIAPDGLVRGQEQVPAWLVWSRQHLMRTATVLAWLGALTLVAGFVWPVWQRRQAITRA